MVLVAVEFSQTGLTVTLGGVTSGAPTCPGAPGLWSLLFIKRPFALWVTLNQLRECVAWGSVWALALVNQFHFRKRMAVLSLAWQDDQAFGWSLNCHPAVWGDIGTDYLNCRATQWLLNI